MKKKIVASLLVLSSLGCLANTTSQTELSSTSEVSFLSNLNKSVFLNLRRSTINEIKDEDGTTKRSELKDTNVDDYSLADIFDETGLELSLHLNHSFGNGLSTTTIPSLALGRSSTINLNESVDGGSVSGEIKSKSTQIAITQNLQYDIELQDNRVLSPFIALGYGKYSKTVDFEISGTSAGESITFRTKQKIKSDAINISAGAKFQISKNYILMSEYKLTTLKGLEAEIDGVTEEDDSSRAKYTTISLGIGYQF